MQHLDYADDHVLAPDTPIEKIFQKENRFILGLYFVKVYTYLIILNFRIRFGKYRVKDSSIPNTHVQKQNLAINLNLNFKGL